MPHHGHGSGPELRFGQRPRRSLYADDDVEEPDTEERVAGLFNAAWYEVARGAWVDAEATLSRLLAIAPDDGEGLVLLAKVHVAQGHLLAALETLDAARDVGQRVDPNLRQAIVDRVGYDPAGELGEETPSVPVPNIKDAVVARQTSYNLRREAEDLREKVQNLEREIRRWIFATMGVCVTATGIVTWALVPPVPPPSGSPALAAVWQPGHEPPAPAPPTPLGEVADTLMPGVSRTLAAQVVDGVAHAEGQLADYRERQAIEALWLEQPHVDAVDWSAVTVTSPITGARVLVRPGDTLSGIAFRYYGDAMATRGIAAANQIEAATALEAGRFLTVPPRIP